MSASEVTDNMSPASAARENSEPLNPTCAPWCERREIAGHRSDPACWNEIDYCVPLTLEDGYPADALPREVMRFDSPRIGVNAYRRAPGCEEIVFLHVYRASDNDHIALDDNLRLTIAEAEELIDNLHAVIDLINTQGLPR